VCIECDSRSAGWRPREAVSWPRRREAAYAFRGPVVAFCYAGAVCMYGRNGLESEDIGHTLHSTFKFPRPGFVRTSGLGPSS